MREPAAARADTHEVEEVAATMEPEAVAQTDTTAAPKTSAEAERFKRRVVRAVERLLVRERREPDEVWAALGKHTGRDCLKLWSHMRALALKKLSRCLALSDVPPPALRPTAADWRVFDRVLFLEGVDVITVPDDPEGDLPVFYSLAGLVAGAGVEDLRHGPGDPAAPRDPSDPAPGNPGDPTGPPDPGGRAALLRAWLEVTHRYNRRGRRASPTLLQLRWHQLKRRARGRVLGFWHAWRGNARARPDAAPAPAPIDRHIVKNFPHVVTEPWADWPALVAARRVVTAQEFQDYLRNQNRTESDKIEDVGPDIVLLEPHVETITVDDDGQETNEPNETNSETTTQTTQPVKVKTEPAEDFVDEIDLRCDDSDLDNEYEEEMRNVMQIDQDSTNDAPNEMSCDEIAPISMDIEANPVQLCKDNVVTEVHSSDVELVEDTANVLSDLSVNLVDVLTQPVGEEIDDSELTNEVIREQVVLDEYDEETPTDIPVDGLSNVQIVQATHVPTVILDDTVTEDTEDVTDKSEQPLQINKPSPPPHAIVDTPIVKIEDDVIAIEDEEIPPVSLAVGLPPNTSELTHEYSDDEYSEDDEYMEDDLIRIQIDLPFDDASQTFDDEGRGEGVAGRGAGGDHEAADDGIDGSDTASKSTGNGVDDEEQPKFDLKLLMNPVVYTTRLDQMTSLKDADYENVQTERLLSLVLQESKPVSAQAINQNLQSANQTGSVEKVSGGNIFSIDSVPLMDQRLNESPDIFDDDFTSFPDEFSESIDDKRLRSDLVPLIDQKLNESLVKLPEEVSLPDECSESSDEEIPRVNWGSKLFRKPERREYLPQQICKNPDFNTTLKRLPIRFLAWPTNREHLKKLNPLTIDVCKSFERVLVNKTVYLKNCPTNEFVVKTEPLTALQTELDNNDPVLNDLVHQIKRELVTIQTDETSNVSDTEIPLASNNINSHSHSIVSTPTQAIFSHQPNLEESVDLGVCDISELDMKPVINDIAVVDVDSDTECRPTAKPKETPSSAILEIDLTKNNKTIDTNAKETNRSEMTRAEKIAATKKKKAEELYGTAELSRLEKIAVTKMKNRRLKQMSQMPAWCRPAYRAPNMDPASVVLPIDTLRKILGYFGDTSIVGQEFKAPVKKKKRRRKKNLTEDDSSAEPSQADDNTQTPKTKDTESTPQDVQKTAEAAEQTAPAPTIRVKPAKPKRYMSKMGHCCWAGEAMYRLNSIRMRKRLMKPDPCGEPCVCCCRARLDAFLDAQARKAEEAENAIQRLDEDSLPDEVREITVGRDPLPVLTVCGDVGAEVQVEETAPNDHATLTAAATRPVADDPPPVVTNDIAVPREDNEEPAATELRAQHADYDVIELSDTETPDLTPKIPRVVVKTRKLTNVNRVLSNKSLLETPNQVGPNRVARKYIVSQHTGSDLGCPISLGVNKILLTDAVLAVEPVVGPDSIGELYLTPDGKSVLLLPSNVGRLLESNNVDTEALAGPVATDLLHISDSVTIAPETMPSNQSNSDFQNTAAQSNAPQTIDQSVGDISNVAYDINQVTEPSTDQIVDIVPKDNTESTEDLEQATSNVSDTTNVANDLNQVTEPSTNQIADIVPKDNTENTQDIEQPSTDQIVDIVPKDNTENTQDIEQATNTTSSEPMTVETESTNNDETMTNTTDETSTSVTETSATGDSGKKSILSDLMMMSGISSDDIVPDDTTPAVVPVDTTPAVVPEFRGCVQRLAQIQSLAALKQASLQGARFFQYDVVTKNLVKIKISMETLMSRGPAAPLAKPIMIPNSTILSTLAQRKVYTARGVGVTRGVTALRGRPPNILRQYSRNSAPRARRGRPLSLLRHPIPTSIQLRQKPRETVKGVIDLDSEDSMEAEYLEESSSEEEREIKKRYRMSVRNVYSKYKRVASDELSDDEPLAKKVTRRDSKANSQEGSADRNVESTGGNVEPTNDYVEATKDNVEASSANVKPTDGNVEGTADDDDFQVEAASDCDDDCILGL